MSEQCRRSVGGRSKIVSVSDRHSSDTHISEQCIGVLLRGVWMSEHSSDTHISEQCIGVLLRGVWMSEQCRRIVGGRSEIVPRIGQMSELGLGLGSWSEETLGVSMQPDHSRVAQESARGAHIPWLLFVCRAHWAAWVKNCWYNGYVERELKSFATT